MLTVREWIAQIPRGIIAQKNADGTGTRLPFTISDVFLAAAKYPNVIEKRQERLVAHAAHVESGLRYECCESLGDLITAVGSYVEHGGNGYNGRLWSSVLLGENLDPKKLVAQDAETLAVVRSWFRDDSPKEVALTQVA